jgi:RNA polymerase sigma factor (sigma-70 family)
MGREGRYMNQEALEKAFIKDFTEYGDAIFRFCMVKVSNKELAEDMTQEVFTRYWQSLREGKHMTNTRAFLYTIASNMAKDWYKKKKSVSLDAHMEANQAPASTEPSPESNASYHEALRAIEGMDEKDASVLLLRFVEGLEPKDIAEILNESANVVSVRINRAMTRLKENLGA